MSRMPERRPPRQVADPRVAPPDGEQSCRILPLPRESAAQFDTQETKFFKEGDELCGTATVVEAFDEPTSRYAHLRRRHLRLLGAAAAIVAVILGVSLVARRTRPPSPLALSVTPTIQTMPVSAPPAVAVPAPAAPPYPTSPPQAAAGAPLAQPQPVADRGALDACQDAYGRGRRKEVLSACAQAFADNPKSAKIAVMLAKTELDRGRTRQALEWAKQAVALDEKQADAYVLLGGAEQAIGHPAAAKAAYQRYLQLAPKGRYAADLRAVLGSL